MAVSIFINGHFGVFLQRSTCVSIPRYSDHLCITDSAVQRIRFEGRYFAGVPQAAVSDSAVVGTVLTALSVA